MMYVLQNNKTEEYIKVIPSKIKSYPTKVLEIWEATHFKTKSAAKNFIEDWLDFESKIDRKTINYDEWIILKVRYTTTEV